MQQTDRWTGLITIGAGMLALLSLWIGLIGVDFDFEVFSDTPSLIAIGADQAGFIRWSNWLNMLGSYLLLMPLAIYLYYRLHTTETPRSFALSLFTVSGLFYLFLGAAGAAILAETWPLLIGQYATATATQQEQIVAQMRLATAIGEGGLQGVVQNIFGTVWLLGVGTLLRHQLRAMGWWMMLLGLFQLSNTVGNLLNVELASLLGLTGTILLLPLWAMVMGIVLLRSKF